MLAGRVRQGLVRLVRARFGRSGQARRGASVLGESWRGRVRQFWHGSLGMEWQVWVRQCSAGCGMARQASHVAEGLVSAWPVRAGLGSLVGARRGMACFRMARRGEVWLGGAGMASPVLDGRVMARPARRVQARQGMATPGLVGPGTSRHGEAGTHV